MKTNNKIGAYILRGSAIALLFSCLIVAFSSAINLAAHPRKAAALHDIAVFSANAHQNRSLSFTDRVAYQRAIENVYWRHRIWPRERRDPKPSLDAVMSQAQLEQKVEDYLRNSKVLEDYWQNPARNASQPSAAMQQLRAGNDAGGPLTADQLQTEMERMASNTKQPEVLREIFEALGNDPFVIAECLARPVLAERLIGEFSSGTKDRSFRAKSRNPATRLTANSARSFDSAQDDIAANLDNVSYHLPIIRTPSGGCSGIIWTGTSEANPPSERAGHTAIWTGTEMIVWGGNLNTGGRYNPSTDTWADTSTTGAPEVRTEFTAVWTGTEMIVWGGWHQSVNTWLNTGGKYDPGTDSWTATNTIGAPEPRSRHTAVWTGSEMIVWGGWNDSPVNTWFDTGGRYDPIANSWTATNTIGAPDPRSRHTAVWTGNEMIVWGGDTNSDTPLNTGGKYDPVADSWTVTSTTGAPDGRYGHEAVLTESEMIVWGGYSPSPPEYFNSGGRYNLSTDSWIATNTARAPDARVLFTAIWTGVEMLVWGGWNVNIGPMNTGAGYDPLSDRWFPISLVGAPEARYGHSAVWTGSEMIVWGGSVAGPSPTPTPVKTGGRYCPVADGHPIRRYHDPRTRPLPPPRPTPPSHLTPPPSPSASGRPTPAPRP